MVHDAAVPDCRRDIRHLEGIWQHMPAQNGYFVSDAEANEWFWRFGKGTGVCFILGMRSGNMSWPQMYTINTNCSSLSLPPSRHHHVHHSDTLQTNLSPLTLLFRNSSNAFCALSTISRPSISLYLFGCTTPCARSVGTISGCSFSLNNSFYTIPVSTSSSRKQRINLHPGRNASSPPSHQRPPPIHPPCQHPSHKLAPHPPSHPSQSQAT